MVIPAHNEGDNLVDTVGWVLANGGDSDLEVVVADDGSTDRSGQRVARRFGGTGRVSVVKTGGVGAGQARNLGAREARGEVLVFLDGHCYTPPGWLTGLTAPLDDDRIGLVGCGLANLSRCDGALGLGVAWRGPSLETRWLGPQGKTAYPVPLLPGGCHAMRRGDFESFGAYDEGMTRWGCESEELCLRFWLLGLQVVVQPRVVIHHLFRDRFPYAVEVSGVIFNRLRNALTHFSPERAQRVLDQYKPLGDFSSILMALLESDVMERRRYWQERRRHTDDWYFERFGDRV